VSAKEEKYLFVGQCLVSTDLFTRLFSCHIEMCKGACCWKGDYGAPLTRVEADSLIDHRDSLIKTLPEPSAARLTNTESAPYYKDMHSQGTQLHPDGSCVYMSRTPEGYARCLLEVMHQQDKSVPDKPESCYLYPIRVRRDLQNGLDILEYDQWEICSAACDKGEREGTPLYVFARKGLEKKYGETFYKELHEHYLIWQEQQSHK